ncbi:MAG: hypothetical protein LAN71_16985 [Acidobacteriia bacterium]|nr:hypothetical protein [Terriglobia bacterium]
MLTEEDLIKHDRIIKMLEDSSNKTKTVEELAIMVLEIFDVKSDKNKTKILEATKDYVKRMKKLDTDSV